MDVSYIYGHLLMERQIAHRLKNCVHWQAKDNFRIQGHGVRRVSINTYNKKKQHSYNIFTLKSEFHKINVVQKPW